MNFNDIITVISYWVVPGMILSALIFAYLRGVQVFDTFVEGAKEGLQMCVKLVPFLIGMMVAVGIFRESGAMQLLSNFLAPLLSLIDMPGEIIPLALMRPVSGSGALAITTELMNIHGADSLIGRMASTMQGSTDTTLFVLTVYFGTIGIKKVRYALIVGLIGDITGIMVAVYISNMVFS